MHFRCFRINPCGPQCFIALLCLWIFLVAVTRMDLCNFQDFLINQELVNVPTMNKNSLSVAEFTLNGTKEMKLSSVSIIGVGKDIGVKLKIFLRQVEDLANLFNHSQVIFAEGDSIDGSNRILKEWEAVLPSERKILTVSSRNQSDDVGIFSGLKLPREGRISFARNEVLAELRKRPATDFVIAIDMDILGWDMGGVVDSFSRSQTWDGICAHGILLHGLYRDTYALRTMDLNNNHHLCGHDHLMYNISGAQMKLNRINYQVRALNNSFAFLTANHQKSKKTTLQLMDINRIRSFQQKTNGVRPGESLKPIHVDSCFGGLAIYK